ncbi:MAG: hypothetical protein ACOY17_01230 [Pseudomonadota bacterium]|jgi:hypothetical protein
MYIVLYIIGGFMMVLGLGTLVVQDPGKGLTFTIILILAALVTGIILRASDSTPRNPE